MMLCLAQPKHVAAHVGGRLDLLDSCEYPACGPVDTFDQLGFFSFLALPVQVFIIRM